MQKVILFLAFISFLIYISVSIYLVIFLRKLHFIYLYSNNFSKLCKDRIEKYTTRNYQYKELKKLNIFSNYKTQLSLFVAFFISICILNILVLITSFLNFRNFKIFKFILAFSIVISIPFIYMYLNITSKFKNKEELLKNIANYEDKLAKVLMIKDKLDNTTFDLNNKNENTSIEILKYKLLQKVLIEDDLINYDQAKSNYEDYIQLDKDFDNKYYKLIDYINFDKDSFNYKILRSILCGDMCSNNNCKINLTGEDYNITNAIKEIINMTDNDFVNLLNRIKNKELYDFTDTDANTKKEFSKYKQQILDLFNNNSHSYKYFNNLRKDDDEWSIWNSITLKDKNESLIKKFNISNNIDETTIDSVLAILSGIDKIKSSNESNDVQALREINKMNPDDFNKLMKEIKKLYLYKNNYETYIENILSVFNNNNNFKNSIQYFKSLPKLEYKQGDYNNSDWLIWHNNIYTNDRTLFTKFNNRRCLYDGLKFGSDEKKKTEFIQSLNSLSTNDNDINSSLDKIITNLLYTNIIFYSILFYIIYHIIYKINKQYAIYGAVMFLIIYFIEEIVRISLIEFI